MIKFFKTLRHKMMSENKTARYLKYALGEIILVVVGILIAIQINEWKNVQARKTLGINLLVQVKEEILSIQKDIENDLSVLVLGQSSSAKISEHMKTDEAYNNELCFDFYFMYKDEYIYPKKAVYSKIKNEGLDIITNDTINYFLQDLYESHFPRISKDNPFKPDIEDYFSDYYHSHFTPNEDLSLHYEVELAHTKIKTPQTLTSADGTITKRTIGYVPNNYENLRQDSKFKMLVSKTDEFRTYKIGRYSRTKVIIDQLIPMIERELDQLKN